MKKIILIVEDEFQIRKDIELILQMNDFDTISAENGSEALKMLENVTPDLIVSDIMMPVMDGFQLLEEVQKNQELINIPFLFLTAKTDKKDYRNGMNLGADDYITKPFNFNELLDAINTRIKKINATKQIIDKTFDDLRISIKYSLPHEIRNPINIILGFADLLRSNFKKTEYKEALEMLDNIYSAGLKLNEMFENYLLMANLEMLERSNEELSKKLFEKTTYTDILISDIVKAKAEEYDRLQDLTMKLKPCDVFIEKDFFNKIIYELSDNAFKFSEVGDKVEINTKLEDRFYTIEILDYGRGMTFEQISRVGEYIQFERKLYEQQGLGLGLSIAKKIVDLHKGIFKIESKVEEFTKFIVKLPRA